MQPNPGSLSDGNTNTKMVTKEENEMNLDKSNERHMGESIENEVDDIHLSSSKSDKDNAEFEEISTEEKLTHKFLYTSTPKKRKLQCEGCSQQTQCDDCLDDWVENYLTKKKLTK